VIDAAHPALPGHFPGKPIVPAAILLDHVVQHVEVAFARRVIGIRTAKFMASVPPEQACRLEVSKSVDNVISVTGVVREIVAFSVVLVLSEDPNA
jgi:3-hydroxymyristoyl/3-hydroxydecanoyl-(acyl carrier protein) dehydratase